jgi:hypothetical protein
MQNFNHERWTLAIQAVRFARVVPPTLGDEGRVWRAPGGLTREVAHMNWVSY